MRVHAGTATTNAAGAGVDVRLVRELGELRRLRRGHELYREGSTGGDVFAVVTGAVELSHGQGRTRVAVAVVGPGHVAGGLDALVRAPRCCTARVLVSTAAICVNGDRLLDAMARREPVSTRWLVTAQRELRDAHARIALLAERSVLIQVARLLLDNRTTTGSVALTQAAVASRLARSRQSINESLHRLRELGIIEPGYRSIVVLDPDRLALLAASAPR